VRRPLVTGLVLIALGIFIFVYDYVGLYECAHSLQTSSCVNPRVVWGNYEIRIAWFMTGLLALVGTGLLAFLLLCEVHIEALNREKS
jgi:hypothetical protein